MTYGHLQADCLYTGISSGPNARCRVWEAFTFTFLVGTSIADLQFSGRVVQSVGCVRLSVSGQEPQKKWHYFDVGI